MVYRVNHGPTEMEGSAAYQSSTCGALGCGSSIREITIGVVLMGGKGRQRGIRIEPAIEGNVDK
jgi:hypothetical protein